MASKPEIPSATMDASAPPATNASASPNLMMRHASPMALFAVAHAVTWHMFGPCSPRSMLSWPLAMLEIIIGIMNGETRLGPFVMRTVCWISRVERPPMPLPSIQPKRVGSAFSMSTPESVNAILPAPIINWCIAVAAADMSFGIFEVRRGIVIADLTGDLAVVVAHIEGRDVAARR